jgi:hypothetical protein
LNKNEKKSNAVNIKMQRLEKKFLYPIPTFVWGGISAIKIIKRVKL